MNTLIVVEPRPPSLHPLVTSRPRSLIPVAGNTIVGQLLDQLSAIITPGSVSFLVSAEDVDQVAAWLRQHYPHVAGSMLSREPHQPISDTLQGIPILESHEPLLLVSDAGVPRYAFAQLGTVAAASSAEIVILTDPQAERQRATGLTTPTSRSDAWPDPGYRGDEAQIRAVWVCQGALLNAAQIDDLGDSAVTGAGTGAGLVAKLRATKRSEIRHQLEFWLPIGDFKELLQANQRLLSTHSASEDAIERSYAEDFTVLPPVFLHPSAEIVSAVVGPYVTIGNGSVVENSVVRNSIVGSQCHVMDCVLDRAIIDSGGRFVGQPGAPIMGYQGGVER